MSNMIRVLSIDGGGIRAIIPAMVLAYIEEQTGKHTADLFDLLAGTSSGGIVALGAVYPGTADKPRYSAQKLADLFLDEGEAIFGNARFGAMRQLIDEKHPHAPLEGVLKRYFGDTLLSDATKPIIVPSYDVETASPRFFNSRRIDRDGNVKMWQVARATTAAPTFFESFRLDIDGRTEALIDGGMIANNPAMVAMTEMTHHIEDYVMTDRFSQNVVVLSLGTGRLRQYYTHNQIKDWGALDWARPAIEITITGGVETVHKQMEEILRSNNNDRYYRLQTDVPDASRAMDDASASNLVVIQELAQKLIDDHKQDLDELIEKLV